MNNLNNPPVIPAIPAIPTIKYGYYTGNDTANRAIPHGLGASCTLVIIHNKSASNDIGDETYQIMVDGDRAKLTVGGVNSSLAVQGMNSTNFYVGNATSYARTANAAGIIYHWIAFAVSL